MSVLELDKTRLRELARYSGDPWTPDNAYFALAESEQAGFNGFWEQKIWPLISASDFSHAVDLAAGHGRNSEKLFHHAQRLTIMDIQPGNIAICRNRFSHLPQVDYVINSGFDFAPTPDDTVTFIYCFDSMVHFDSDVIRMYLRDGHRILKAGGTCFLHHSNYSGGHDWRSNPEARNFMTRELFAHYAMKEGLEVLSQEVINWGNYLGMDCLTLLRKPIA